VILGLFGFFVIVLSFYDRLIRNIERLIPDYDAED